MLRKLVVGWKVFEAAGFEPVFPQKDDAIGYASFAAAHMMPSFAFTMKSAT